MRRLQRFESTARLIAAGDLQRRVPVSGSDTLAWLGQEFNAMADTMTGLLSDVRHEREQLETVINSIDDGIVVLDADRRVVAANDAFLRRRERTREEVLGASCRDPATGMCGTGVCPTQACLQLGERQVRICERKAGGRRDRLGRGARVARSAGRPAPSSRSWRSGATSPSAGRPRRGWPSPTGSLPWACWPRASRTS